jgi:hypothetical protein
VGHRFADSLKPRLGPFDFSIFPSDEQCELTLDRRGRSPGDTGWNVRMAAGKLTADNSGALGTCREAAAKTKKEQHCVVVVPPAP